ncbi:MAG: hypothetical protein MK078_09790 [Crocinitomicaceae bacterium]|nr:hypothetical protein [Crocinitomicaceae bacterium]
MRYLVLLILFLSLNGIAQDSAKEVCASKLKELQKSKDGLWRFDSDTSLIWVYRDTFTTMNRTSAIRRRAQADSIVITLKFQDNWSADKMEKTSVKNTAIIDPLSEKFIAALDSMNWEGLKLDKQTFLSNKMLYLPYLRSITKFTEEDMANYNKVVRLPDFLINGVGVFLDGSPNYAYQYIDEIEIDALYFDQLQFISKTLGAERTKIGLRVYEL